MIGRNFIVKNVKNFSESNAKLLPENPLPLPRNRQKTEMISLSYDGNSLTMLTQC